MTKKLTKVAMTTALAAAAIVPAVVATPAQAAEAEVTFAKAYYTTANGTAAFDAGKLGVVVSATGNKDVTYLEGSNGEVFEMKTFSAYFAGNPTATTNEILTALSTAGKALSADQVKALNVKEGKVENNKVTVDADAPVADVKVESVKAINASELQVTFSAPVTEKSATDTKNYQLKINNVDHNDIQDIQLSKDGKVATILLDQTSTTKTAFQNGDKYVIQTNDAIVAANGKKLEKFVSNEATFSETAAPSLTKVTKSGDSLELTFDRPVSSNDTTTPNAVDVGLIKIDGIEIGSKDLKPVAAKAGTEVLGKAGNYSYKVDITAPDAKAQAKKLGNHEVVIFDVKDTASAYVANASVLTGSYTVTDAVTAPEVTGIEAVNANRFFVYTNTSVTLGTDAVVTVNKGTHEFKLDTTKYDGTIQTADTITNSDAVVGTYKNKPGIWVTVTDNKGAVEENPLYRSGEAAVNLTVTVEKYTADGLIGKKSVQNVTLNKNNTKPVVDTTVLKETATGTADELVVTFTNDLVQLDGQNALTLTEGTDFVVRNKEGIIVTGFTATVSGKDVKFTKGTADLKDAPYTVEFKEGKFKNKEDRTNVATYLANTVKNDAFTVTVGKEAASNFKYTEFKFDTTVGTGNTTVEENSITFKLPTKMGDSARNVANYTLDGKGLPAGTTVDFVNDRQTVKVVFPKGTFKTSTQYKFGITTNVKTEADSMIVGSLQTKAPAELVFSVKDNVKPELASAVYYVGTESVTTTTKTNKIEVTFNEAVNITDNATKNAANDFAVVINGSTYDVASVAQATIGDDKERKLVLTLKDQINVSQAATISIVPEADQVGSDANVKEIAVKDTAGNKAKEGSQVTLAAGKYKYTSSVVTADAKTSTEVEKAIQDTLDNGTLNLNLAGATEAITITTDKALTINLSGNMSAQNLIVDAKNSTVNNSATTTGTITIKDVSNATWNENAQRNKIFFNDKDAGTNFVVGAGATVASLTVNGPAVVTNNGTVTALVVGADVTAIVNGTAPAKISGTGTVTGSALPKGEATAELNVEGLTTDTLKFLVFGLPADGAQQASTLDQVKSHIDTKYNVDFKKDNIKVENGVLKVTGPLLSTEDWNKVKTNGDKALPYKITVLKDAKTSKVAKIAMYQDGTVNIEKLPAN